jgi:hypothetical protein
MIIKQEVTGLTLSSFNQNANNQLQKKITLKKNIFSSLRA